jgi:hypothetical protein
MAYFIMLLSVLKQALTKPSLMKGPTKRLVDHEERTFDAELFAICKTPIHRLIRLCWN